MALVECGFYKEDDEVAYQVCERYLGFLRGTGADTLILGCTHFFPDTRTRSFQRTLNLISINGTHENDLSHETFFISNNGDGWNFCKTARKPYDYAVREIIKAAEKEKLITDVASDGENNEIISDKDYLGE